MIPSLHGGTRKRLQILEIKGEDFFFFCFFPGTGIGTGTGEYATLGLEMESQASHQHSPRELPPAPLVRWFVRQGNHF